MQQPGVLVARPDGVIVVPNAIPLPSDWLTGLNALIDQAEASARRDPPPADPRDPPK